MIELFDCSAPLRRAHQAFRRRDLIEERRFAAPDLAAFEPHRRLLPDRVHQRQRKAVLRQRVDQRSLAAELPQLGECRRDQRLPQLGIGGRPDGGQRQEITLPLAACELRLDDPRHERFRPPHRPRAAG